MIAARPSARDSLLFVYGTLRAFIATAAGNRLRRQSSLVARGRVAGRLYDLGRYPGLAPPRRRGDWVVGEVYRLANPCLTLRALDLYEAGARVRPQFVRVRCVVRARHAGGRAAWVYLYCRGARRRPRIVSGDYRRHLIKLHAKT